MKKPPLHESEKHRLEILRKRGILENTNNTVFDDVIQETKEVLDTPIVSVTMIDEHEEVFICSVGVEAESAPRETSFCGHALVQNGALVVEDTQYDERFIGNPQVMKTPYIRFYMGMRLLDRGTGLPLGVFCVKDTKPRKVSTFELSEFMRLAEKCQDILDTV